MATVHDTRAGRAADTAAPADQAMRWLRDAFERGDYARGDRLPAERELCARAGVSRTTMRPVLAQLAAEGVISLAGRNITIQSGASDDIYGFARMDRHAARLVGDDGKLLFDMETLRITARSALIDVL